MKIKVFVGAIVFVLAMAGQWLVLQPDTTPRLLTGRAWLPSSEVSSKLLNERNNRKQQVSEVRIGIEDFRKIEFEVSDVVFVPALGSDHAPYLDYFGRIDEKWVSSAVSLDDVLPRRSVLYKNDARTYHFDRQTGEVRVESEFNEIAVAGLLIVALILAVSFAITTPDKFSEILYWVAFVFCGGLNFLAFYLWQVGRSGFSVEAGIAASAIGVLAFWCYAFYFGSRLHDEGSRKRHLELTDLLVSLVLTALGILFELIITIGLFFGPGKIYFDLLPLAGYLAAAALIVDLLVALWISLPEKKPESNRAIA